MRLKSFGCSFVFGSDLHDCPKESREAISRYTWPALLAEHLGYHYDCYAYPGVGNFRIAERILRQTARTENKLFVISWTWIDRFDYTNDSDQWQSITPATDTDIGRRYYRDYHSQYRDKLSTLMNIRLCIDSLKQKNFPFIMTYMDELIFETKWHSSPAITELQNYIRPYLNNFQGKTFLEWSKDNNFEISSNMHPLEDAHRAAADLIINDLDNWIKH